MSLVRIEWEGIENVPREGGALLVASAAPWGSLRRPGEIGTLAHELEDRTHREVHGLSAAENGRAHRLLHDGQQLGLVLEEALAWAVETALRAGVPIVPVMFVPGRIRVLPVVHFDALANQRGYDPVVVAADVERVATELRAAYQELDAEPAG